MDKTAIEDIFAPVGKVALRRMFGGIGVYLHGLCVALVYEGSIWMKANETTRKAFEDAGSTPFQYWKKTGDVSVMRFWMIPEVCLDGEQALKHFVSMAETAARHAAAAKSRPIAKSMQRKAPA